MTDYKKMYLTLVDETTKAIDNLIAALRSAEHIYIETCGDANEEDTDDKHDKASRKFDDA